MTFFKNLKISASQWTLGLGFAVFYFFLAFYCLHLSFKGTNASPVWPPSGFAFLLLWYCGYRFWPAIWLGAFVANVVFFEHLGWISMVSTGVSSLIAVGNTAEALLAVLLLRGFVGKANSLCKIAEIFKFVFAVLAASCISASIGTSSVYFVHHPQGFSYDLVWFTWWLGDVVGILVIAPLFLTFHSRLWSLKSWRNALEAVLVLLILGIINVSIFTGKFPVSGFSIHVTYLVLPFAIWATYRFGFAGANITTLLTAAIAVLGSTEHLGPFNGRVVPADLVIVQCFIGVFSITVLSLAAALYERQKAEESTKDSEARFRNLVENSFEVIALVDQEAKIIYSSPSTKVLLGYDLSEIKGHSMFEWMHHEDIPAVREIFAQVAQAPGGIAHATCRMRRKDGVWRWMEGSGHNLLADPTIEAIVINYRDITERKLSQQHFEQVVEYSPVAKLIFNKQGEITLINRSAESLFGYSRQELFHMNIEDLIPEELRTDHPFSQRNFGDESKSKSIGGREILIQRKDGKQVAVEIGLTLIETEQGLSVLASMLDITQRKRAEAILKRDKESLEQLVDERSKELIKTQKELKHFSRLADIGTLAATVAHELRNPLGVIHLAAYNLKKEKGELNTNRHLMNIEKKVWEGNQIIDNLLSYARIKIPNYEEVHISVVLDECVASAQGRFAEKGIVIEKKYKTGVGSIEADPNQAREIFLNILNNACQAYNQAQGKVEVDLAQREGMVVVTVRDYGVGIAEEDMDKIFEPFFTRKSKGTGLGLTIVNELVNLHQGKIEINSRIGDGTTVAVFLPIHRRENGETAAH